MNFFFVITLSSTCVALASYFACLWYIPSIRNSLQKPIEASLLRAGKIGFDSENIRNVTFAIEVLTMLFLLWASYVYMGVVLGATLFAISIHFRTLILAWIIETRERLLRVQTLSFTVGLMGLTRGGLSLSQAFDKISSDTPKPLGIQVQRIAMEHRRGRPLAEAIDAVRAELCLDSFSLLVTSITCALKQGSSLEASLAGVQDSLEHRAAAERQLFAKTSSARATILILSGTTPGFFLLFWLMMPDSMDIIFLTAAGKKMMAAILVLLYSGIAWSRHLLNIK